MINSKDPSLRDIPESTLLYFLQLCDPRLDSSASFADFLASSSSISRESSAVSASQQSWEQISQLARLHGVTPFLFYRTRQLGIQLPEEIKKEWLGIYLYSLAQDQKALRQIKELKEILDPAGVPFILLKGASAMLRLYPEPGLRTFVDLDILIPVDKADQFKRAMIDGGYKPLCARNSPEDEELQKFDLHLDPLWKDGSLMVEAHLNILGVKGDYSAVNPEIWQERQETKSDGLNVNHLNIEHFVIHTLLHYSKHLSNEGFSEIKWFIDLLNAIKTWKIDWGRVRDISRKWRVEKDVLPLTATLNHYWQTQVPLLAPSQPIALDVLVLGKLEPEKQFYAELPTSYIRRFLQFRNLPRTTSKFRYILHLLFPTSANLHWRYHLSSKWFLGPYYFFHLFYTLKKFLKGMFYQFVYRPKPT